jgi:hypothetical protein
MRSLLRPLSLAVALVLLLITGCASVGEDAEGSVTQEARPVCYSSDDCAADKYCTTEDGVCNSPCRPNQVCVQVCSGTCRKGERATTCDYTDPSRTYVSTDMNECALIRYFCPEGQSAFSDDCGCGCEEAPAGESCGPATCGAGQVCCNASCGICTEPGEFCTQQVCGSAL